MHSGEQRWSRVQFRHSSLRSLRLRRCTPRVYVRPPGGDGPRSLRPVLAFLVVSHRNPRQVLRLVRTLREGSGVDVLVHHDQRTEPIDPAECRRAGGRLVHYGLRVEWGNVAYTEMLLRALADLAESSDPDWIAVASGQDYPLRPLADFERHLAESPHQALLRDLWELDLSREPGSAQREFYLRYRYHHYAPPRPLAAMLARALGRRAYLRELPGGLGLRLGVRPRTHPFGPTLRCHVSSDWLTLERSAVHAVLEFTRANTAVMRHYRRTIIPSESLFATVLANDPTISIGPASRFFGFEAGSPHPRTLTSADLEALVASGMHFARKFDEAVDAQVLDLLDEFRARVA